MPKAGKLGANLVGAAREQAHLHKACPVLHNQRAHKAQGFFAVGRVRAHGAHLFKAVYRVLAQKMPHKAGFFMGPASGYPCHVFLDHALTAKGLLGFVQCRIGCGHKQDARCFLVQPVHGRGHKACVGKMPGQAGCQAVFMPGSGMGGQAGGLVKSPQVAAGADKRRQRRAACSFFIVTEFACGRWQRIVALRGHFYGKGGQANEVTGLYARKRFASATVYPHLSRAHPTVQHGLGEVQTALQKLK